MFRPFNSIPFIHQSPNFQIAAVPLFKSSSSSIRDNYQQRQQQLQHTQWMNVKFDIVVVQSDDELQNKRYNTANFTACRPCYVIRTQNSLFHSSTHISYILFLHFVRRNQPAAGFVCCWPWAKLDSIFFAIFLGAPKTETSRLLCPRPRIVVWKQTDRRHFMAYGLKFTISDQTHT